ncbi:sensor histidine kinase, partial [Isoptericola sp. QY 916]|nr:sensor histidine kinase [Isoptericola sp. QY 916]
GGGLRLGLPDGGGLEVRLRVPALATVDGAPLDPAAEVTP